MIAGFLSGLKSRSAVSNKAFSTLAETESSVFPPSAFSEVLLGNARKSGITREIADMALLLLYSGIAFEAVYSGLRGENEKLCVLVVMGVNERGQKRFLAIKDGVRESTQSWREVMLGLKARGLEMPRELAAGDGALGFWAALAEVYPAPPCSWRYLPWPPLFPRVGDDRTATQRERVRCAAGGLGFRLLQSISLF